MRGMRTFREGEGEGAFFFVYVYMVLRIVCVILMTDVRGKFYYF
jgi:hypothetical protein